MSADGQIGDSHRTASVVMGYRETCQGRSLVSNGESGIVTNDVPYVRRNLPKHRVGKLGSDGLCVGCEPLLYMDNFERSFEGGSGIWVSFRS